MDPCSQCLLQLCLCNALAYQHWHTWYAYTHMCLIAPPQSVMHFYSCLVLSRPTYGAAESWALTGSQAAQLETFHNTCMRRMMGRYRGTGGPSTAELLDVTDAHLPTNQPPQGQVAGARSPQAGDHHREPAATCRLHPGAPKACRPPPLHVEGWGHARPQRPRAPATDWPKLALDRELWRGVTSRC